MSTLDEPAVARPLPAPRPSAARARRSRPRLPYLLILPALAVSLAVIGYPLIRVIVLSFQQWGVAQIFSDAGPPFVGLRNYSRILGDPVFWTVVVRTLVLTAVMVGLSMGVGVGLALLMERVHAWVRGVMTFSLIMAWAVPTFVSTQIFAWMTEQNFGVLNYVLGLGQHNWYTDAKQGLAVATLIVVWGAVPFITVTTYAALTQVPAELVEAARLDGAGGRQVFFGITLPSIKPVLVIVTALSIIWDFSVFNQIYILRNGAPSPDYQTLAIYAYMQAYQGHEYGYASAVAVVTVLLLLVVSVFYIRQLIKTGEAE
ncbi:N,N'-diacetylchitobiose transport system permease protein [Hamadaea flava]|uniref:Carbohydrate ABC transporter permease n=1 Tax=Hamadaea flava TaxID=1742688 RepID=A0ABV8LWY9_9ACTN|nr:sugar ABC transporter permease [Hamadaea flava]MCP2321716.1 N,N'-diacetylchitobiose transport system permease protein [Hamadaea flava]